ncbi:alpha/beta fold hydrolase [Solwaraspora sp. WMMB335]|uniref:alpha/beta fold hydrolase n=1 Tax=Solwaraspora sp. WMMB335 TaxID=3404118 RepID=UPI003B95AE24
MRTSRSSAGWKSALIAVGSAAAGAGVGVALVKRAIDRYVDPWKGRVAAAGLVVKSAQVGEVGLSYAEGPDNGPPLVLLHAQHMDWFSYSRVLPGLSERFHVFDIDYPGHGATTVPADYPMSANRIGADLAAFIETTVGGPAFVTGNSSGGLLAVWLAANRPELVKGVVLEDPPLFSAEYPRIATTIADRSFATCAEAVRAGITADDDFLLYWIASNKKFFTNNVAPGTASLLTAAIKTYRRAHPGEPVDVGLLPNDTVRLLLRGMDRFDPRFGAAFHDGTWNKGFDHADALADVSCPALLLQADFSILADGTLNGAMSQEDADRAVSLLRTGSYRKIDATHVIHLAQPEFFARTLEEFFLDHEA